MLGDGRPLLPVTARYLTLADTLRIDITTAPPNTLLPTEHQLAKRFGVSRVTVRRALGLLERGGLISRGRGRGTVVSPPKIVRSLAPLYTTEEDFRQQGVKLETQVLHYERSVEPPPHVRGCLKLGTHARVAVLALLRSVEGQRIAYDRTYLPGRIAARLDPETLGERPLIEVVRDLTGIRTTWLIWEIEILPSSAEVATALGITPGVLVVLSATTGCREDRHPVVRTERFYRIDRVKFRYENQYASTSPAGAWAVPDPAPRSDADRLGPRRSASSPGRPRKRSHR